MSPPGARSDGSTSACSRATGGYFLVSTFLLARTTNKRREHDLRNLLRFVVQVAYETDPGFSKEVMIEVVDE
nr:hypothetical protein [Natronomonas sp.]